MGTVFDHNGTDHLAGDDRCRKFYGAVNAAIAKLGGYCMSDLAWKQIMEVQLFPVRAYGSCLGDLQNGVTVRSVNREYRRGICKGLGMRDRDSITDWAAGLRKQQTR